MHSGNSVSYSIGEFLNKSDSEIVGELNDPDLQTLAWRNQIVGLHNTLQGKTGRIVFEYGIPGLSKVCDVILLLNDKIFVLEYKNGAEDYSRADREQTLGYALRLKYFHSESKDKEVIPILVATDADYIIDPHKITDDGVYHLVLSNSDSLKDIIESYDLTLTEHQDWHNEWEMGIFKATPSIIAAAKDIWNKQHVKGLVDEGTNYKSSQIRLEAENTVSRIIETAKREKRKALVFITGVPGAGKTLVGLKISVAAQEHGASLLSGNGPLVEVLSTALRRNLDLQQQNLKEEYESELENYTGTKKDLDSLKDKIAVDSIIRGVYGYKSEIIERLDYKIPLDYDRSTPFIYKIREGAKKCSQHVVIYDEAQRAWSVSKMRQPGRTKKDWQNSDWSFSEPALLLWDMDQLDWGVFICLVGGGQEINEGESGINEWLRTLLEDHDKVNFENWDVYMAPDLNGKEYQLTVENNKSISDYIISLRNSHPELIREDKTLHLTECQRSPLSAGLSSFVNKLVEGDAVKEDYDMIKEGYPIYLTRDINTAKAFLRRRQEELTPLSFVANSNVDKDTIRTGILMSSTGVRLRPLGFDMKKVADYQHKTPAWFLDSKEENIDSSDFLEVALNEFFVQGLEIDLSCIVWDADFRYDNDIRGWKFYKFNKRAWSQKQLVPEIGRSESSIRKKAEANIKTRIVQAYMRNAYRVLLTRARLGMIICVPKGSADDDTRYPEFYNSTFEYLKSLGLNVI